VQTTRGFEDLFWLVAGVRFPTAGETGSAQRERRVRAKEPSHGGVGLTVPDVLQRLLLQLAHEGLSEETARANLSADRDRDLLEGIIAVLELLRPIPIDFGKEGESIIRVGVGSLLLFRSKPVAEPGDDREVDFVGFGEFLELCEGVTAPSFGRDGLPLDFRILDQIGQDEFGDAQRACEFRIQMPLREIVPHGNHLER
jgi:hypothetical protein